MKSGLEENRFNYFALSIKDLLEARETYHVHLSNFPNVVATALSRYRIRRDDPNFIDPKKTSEKIYILMQERWQIAQLPIGRGRVF